MADNNKNRAQDFDKDSLYAIMAETEKLARVGGWEWDIARDVWTFSDNWLRIHGCTARHLKTEGLIQVAHPDDRNDILLAFDQVVNEGANYDIEHRIIRQDTGEERYIRSSGKPRLARDGKVIKIIGSAQDITSQREAEKKLVQKEKRLNEAQRIAQVGDWDWDPATNTVTWSEQLYQIFSLDPGELPPDYRGQLQLYHPEDSVRLHEAVTKALKEGTPYELELRRTNPDGQMVHLLVRGRVETDQLGTLTRLYGTVQDITERIAAEKVLQEINSELKLAQKIARIGNWSLDPEIGMPEWSEEVYEIYERDRSLGPVSLADYPKLYSGLWWETFINAIQNAIQNGIPYDIELKAKLPSGKEKWIHAICEPESNIGPKGYKLRGTIQDITERKNAENDLKNKNQQLQAFWELSRLEDATLKEISDHTLSAILKMTDSPYGFYGFMKEDESEMNIHSWSGEVMKDCTLVSQSTRFVIEDCGLWTEAVSQRRPLIINDYSLPHEGKLGLPVGHINIEKLLVVPFMQSGKIISIAAVANRTVDYDRQDIMQIEAFLRGVQNHVDRHLAQKELRRFEWLLEKEKTATESKNRFFSPIYESPTKFNESRVILNGVGSDRLHAMALDILDLMDTCVAIYEANGDYAYAVFESGWCQLMDESSFKLCGTSDTKAALESGQWLCHECCWNESCKIAIESGQPTDIQCVGGIRLYAVPIFAGDEIIGAMNIGYQNPPTEEDSLYQLSETFNIDYQALKQRAQTYKPRPPFIIEHAKKRCQAMSRMIGEIIERRRAEDQKERVEEQLNQAQKMESVGRMAGGVAHDFNNMLGVILGHTEMALDEIDPSTPLHANLHAVQQAAERSADLTRQLLAFARKQTIAPKVIDLNKTVEGMLKMLRRLIGEDIDLIWQPGSSLQPVKMDPAQIDQILVNLCVNARDAFAGKGKIIIETDIKIFDDAYCADHLGFMPGKYVLLAVSDDGCGMDKKILSQIFEPFFTTKAQGKGTGLGLASVFGMVKQNNGFINVYSEPGQGTTFKVYLPAHARKSTGMVKKEPNLPTEQGNETILLVEDESAILEMTTMMLNRLGYTVVAATTPGEAIRLAHEYQGRIDLLMTDVVMPEMNGRELAGNLLTHYPYLKRLFMSGYTANVIAHHGVLDQGVHFIQKPFSKKDLGAKLREVLEGGGVNSAIDHEER